MIIKPKNQSKEYSNEIKNYPKVDLTKPAINDTKIASF